MSQVSADVVDWKWLKGLPSARAQCDALLEEPPPGKVESCVTIVPDWDLGGVLHGDVGDALETLIAESKGRKARVLKTGLACLISFAEESPDELGLAAASEGCFHASLSPRKVAAAARALDNIDLAAIAEELDPSRRELFERYLSQWATVIRRASQTRRGIVAHMG
jgi:hypothetical protein